MSINRNRAKLNKVECSRDYILVLYNDLYPMYWDEGIYMYPNYRRGFRNSGKQLFNCQRREYRTWKYNRKKQWKF